MPGRHVAFACLRHGDVIGMAGYRRHMDEAHEGRTDCVLGLDREQLIAVLNGADPFKLATTR